MFILTKNRKNLINQINSDQAIKLMNKMNLNRNKNRSKNRRTGSALKFHNFVANCSAINKSTNNSTNSKEITNETTHCLKEEHGTKQITVSHWRKSSNLDPTSLEAVGSSSSEAASNLDILSTNLETNSKDNLNETNLEKKSNNLIDLTQTTDQKTKKPNLRVNKAKSFSLLSNSNSLISRSDFTLHQPNLDTNKNYLIKNLINTNSLQYNNGKQKHLNLKQSSSSSSKISPFSSFRLSSSLKSNKSSNIQFANQLRSFKTNYQSLDNKLDKANDSISINNQINNLISNSINNQLNSEGNNQINKRSNHQFNDTNLSSLNLQRSINQLNLMLNDNLFNNKGNESILSNLLIKESTNLKKSSSELDLNLNKFNLINDNLKIDLINNLSNFKDDNNKISNSVDDLNNRKANRRKPIFVRRLIKVDNIDDLNELEPLDLSLKKRKLNYQSTDTGEPTTSNSDNKNSKQITTHH